MSNHLDQSPGANLPVENNLPPQLGLLDVAGDLVQSAVYSGVQSPLTGALQIVDKAAGTDLADSWRFMSAPKAAKFGSLDWHAQQIGGAIGMILPFFALNKGVGLLADDGGILANPVAQATASGALYGGIFHPSAPGEDFLTSRLKNAAVSGATFGTLALSGSLLTRAAESSFVTSDLASGFLRNGAVAGVLSGVPAGIVSAEGDSLVNGNKGWASGSQLLQSIYGFSMAGGVFGALNGLERPATVPPEQTALPVEGEQPGITLLLRGGAVRGWGHIGVLKYLDEQGVKVDHEYGISIGALVASLHKNGYSGDEIQNIFLDEFHNPLVKKYLPQKLTLRSLVR
ncbi:MAG: patatin-like phospholipase family protein, partial [Terriglobales bacterium]